MDGWMDASDLQRLFGLDERFRVLRGRVDHFDEGKQPRHHRRETLTLRRVVFDRQHLEPAQERRTDNIFILCIT